MKKRIIHKLYFLYILALSFGCLYVIFEVSSYEEIISFFDSNVNEDESMPDSNEVQFDSLGNDLLSKLNLFNLFLASNSLSTIAYFFNIQEIYMGLLTPPPKSQFS